MQVLCFRKRPFITTGKLWKAACIKFSGMERNPNSIHLLEIIALGIEL